MSLLRVEEKIFYHKDGRADSFKNVVIYQSAWHQIPEESNLQSCIAHLSVIIICSDLRDVVSCTVSITEYSS
jgi:hypothetical protein